MFDSLAFLTYDAFKVQRPSRFLNFPCTSFFTHRLYFILLKPDELIELWSIYSHRTALRFYLLQLKNHKNDHQRLPFLHDCWLLTSPRYKFSSFPGRAMLQHFYSQIATHHDKRYVERYCHSRKAKGIRSVEKAHFIWVNGSSFVILLFELKVYIQRLHPIPWSSDSFFCDRRPLDALCSQGTGRNPKNNLDTLRQYSEFSIASLSWDYTAWILHRSAIHFCFKWSKFFRCSDSRPKKAELSYTSLSNRVLSNLES